MTDTIEVEKMIEHDEWGNEIRMERQARQERMDPEWKAKWLEALRSGEYEQGDGRLRSQDDKFCCLGVLTDLVAKDGQVKWGEGYYGGLGVESPGGFEEHVLPTCVVDITHLNPDPVIGGRYTAQLNDNGAPFDYIADQIEEHL